MKIIVCGGRNYSDRRCVFNTLDVIHAETPITILMHGDANGADRLASSWATWGGQAKTKIETFPAQWMKYGFGAGPRRNQEMLDAGPDLVVAFPGGRGTADMVRRARAAGVMVRKITQ